jgi:antitoxin VapB
VYTEIERYSTIEADAIILQGREVLVATTRVFKSGNSQAVRLPKEFSVKSKVVEILRRGDEIVLREPVKGLGRAFEVLTELPDDFLAEGRQDPPPQHREGL